MTAASWAVRGVAVGRHWDGARVNGPVAELDFGVSAGHFRISIRAPFFGDPAPARPTGSTDRLWDFEVVELFVLGADNHYLELEFGPHGHYLALELRGRRQLVRKGANQGLAMDYRSRINGDRWSGIASLPASLLPASATHFNAYALHGRGVGRHFLAHAPCLGRKPDFHNLDRFVPIARAAQSGFDPMLEP